MLRASKVLLLTAFAGALADVAPEQCGVNPDGTSTCSGSDQASLIQSRVKVTLDTDSTQASETLEQHVYGPYASPTSLLSYFSRWAEGTIESRLARMLPVDANGEELSDEDLESLNGMPAVRSTLTIPESGDEEEDLSTLESDSQAMSAEVAAELFEAKAMQECPERAMALLEGGRSEFQVLHSMPADKRGVRHVLLKGKGAQLQYIASYLMPNGEHEALVVDPPACSANGHLSFLEAQAAQGIPNISSSDPIDPNIAAATRGNTSGGEANMLTLDDPLVHDCKMLFVRTMQERCNKSADVSVLVARRLIVDGLAVQMHVQVCKPNTEECKPHRPECDFETSSNHADASLLQAQNGAQDDTPPPLPEEAMGLVATLRLAVELCDADTQPGVNGEDAGDDANLAQYAMGEDSGCKGNEHVYDNIPVYSALEVDTPAEVDFRTKYYQNASQHWLARVQAQRLFATRVHAVLAGPSHQRQPPWPTCASRARATPWRLRLIATRFPFRKSSAVLSAAAKTRGVATVATWVASVARPSNTGSPRRGTTYTCVALAIPKIISLRSPIARSSLGTDNATKARQILHGGGAELLA